MYTFLIVEDDEDNGNLMKELFKEKNDIKCDLAKNGEEGLNLYKQSLIKNQPYNIILIDILIPKIDGLTLLKLIRKQEINQKTFIEIPIFMLTAHKEDLKSAIDYGCDDYILKPINLNDLLNKIRTRLQYG